MAKSCRYDIEEIGEAMFAAHLRWNGKKLSDLLSLLEEELEKLPDLGEGDEDEYELESCECDNTHQAVDTVCRWCWAHGRRKWNDPEVEGA